MIEFLKGTLEMVAGSITFAIIYNVFTSEINRDLERVLARIDQLERTLLREMDDLSDNNARSNWTRTGSSPVRSH